MRKRKPAAVSTEVAIGIAVAVVALFVALGIFGDNLSSIVANSNIGNAFKGSDAKTEYTSYDRDYSDSQVNVQIMGEQGLEMLRRRANNKAIEVIEESFSNSNHDGNSIAYLTTALRILTGESHICTYMKKDSDKHCDEIGDYYYDITALSASSMTIERQAVKNKEGLVQTEGTITIPVDGFASSVLTSVNVPLDGNGYSTLSTVQKYTDIREITTKLLNYIRKDVVLIRGISDFTSAAYSTSFAAVRNAFTSSNGFIVTVKNSAYNAYTKCDDPGNDTDISVSGAYNKTDAGKNCVGYNRIDGPAYQIIDNWATDLNKKLASATTKDEIVSDLTTSLSTYGVIGVLEDDNVIDPSSCSVFTNGLSTINNKYGLNIPVPSCKPSGAKGSGILGFLGNTFPVATKVGITVVNAVVSTVKNVADAISDWFSSWW